MLDESLKELSSKALLSQIGGMSLSIRMKQVSVFGAHIDVAISTFDPKILLLIFVP